MFSTSFGLDSIFRFKKKREIYNPTLVVPVTSSLDEEGGKDSRERERETQKWFSCVRGFDFNVLDDVACKSTVHQ